MFVGMMGMGMGAVCGLRGRLDWFGFGGTSSFSSTSKRETPGREGSYLKATISKHEYIYKS